MIFFTVSFLHVSLMEAFRDKFSRNIVTINLDSHFRGNDKNEL